MAVDSSKIFQNFLAPDPPDESGTVRVNFVRTYNPRVKDDPWYPGERRREPDLSGDNPDKREALNARIALRALVIAIEPLWEYRTTMDNAGVPGWKGVLWENLMEEVVKAIDTLQKRK